MRDDSLDRPLLAGFLTAILLIGATRAFFSSVYYENLATLSINASIAYVLVALAPALLFLRIPPRVALLGSAIAIVSGRIAMALLWGSAAYLPLAAFSFASGLVLLAALLHDMRQADGLAGPAGLAVGLGLGFAFDAALTFAGRSVDSSQQAWPGLILLVPMGGALVSLLWAPAPRPRAWTAFSHSRWALAGAGLGAWIFLEHSVLASPHALARWNELPVAPLVIGTILGLALPALFASRGEGIDWRFLTLLNIVGLFAVMDHAFTHSPFLPLLLVLAQTALVLDLAALLQSASGGALRGAGSAVLVAAGVTVLLHFISAFALTFAYVPFGSIWKGAEKWLVPAAFLLVSLPALAVARASQPAQPVATRRAVASLIVGILLLSAVGIVSPVAPISDPIPGAAFRVMTFNLHQGFDNDGIVDAAVFEQVLREESPDVLSLQESDSPRITSGNLDIITILATKLGYHVVYGPPTSAESFGVSVLSRYPITESAVLQLPSTKDNRYFIEARLDVHGTPVWLYALHLGLPAQDREDQIAQVLSRAATHPGDRRILAGDLNSCPHVVCPDYEGRMDNVYDSVRANYTDTYVAATLKNESDPAAFTYEATNLTQRIDYVWVTPGLDVLSARSVRTEAAIRASDHVPVIVTLKAT
ncbi:MAG: endonuclease/exonuclease/phosphatase family protein [Candidatus Thermoplasmatota archaeon]